MTPKLSEKPEVVYQELIRLADQLGITVLEHNFKTSGVHVTSGLCKIKGRQVYVMDKHKRIHQKIDLLSECLARFSIGGIEVGPDVRRLLDARKPG